MVEVKEETERKIQCLLVGKPVKKEGDATLKELEGLVDTLGLEVCKEIVLARIEPTPAYGLGTGKAKEIADTAKECGADCIIFDWEIDPSKQRNWEKLSLLPCFDRNEVIIRIFAQRAQTKEASLQIELAKLTYSLPRLNHTYGDMARQRGGAFGAKGSGETQLELDRRQIEEKILAIKKELEVVATNRSIQRKQRERTETASCALVGYTNAGKSSLLNALTGADVFVENKLFATLDPTTRKLALAEGSSVLLTDTVGFISNLPHTLIDAFKSTLEETALANLLLITVDSSDEDCLKQYEQVQKVLKEINADKIPQQIILNKWDKVKDDEILIAKLDSNFPNAIKASAKTQEGFDKILECITENLLGTTAYYTIPMSRTDLVELIRKNGTIEEEEWKENCIELKARIPGKIVPGENIPGTNEYKPRATSRTLALVMEYMHE